MCLIRVAEYCVLSWFACFVFQGVLAAEAKEAVAEVSIPYVPTRHDVVKDLLWLAEAGKDDVVYDLGSGDGRIVLAAVRDFNARQAVGIEIDPQKVRESRQRALQAGLSERVKFIEGDLFSQSVRDATVVVVYLGHLPNIQLRAKLFRELKPGARVVSHQFGMGEWSPDKFLRVRTQYLGMFGMTANPFADNPHVPDFGSMDDVSSSSMVRVWILPARIAGIWRGAIESADGKHEIELALHQRMGAVTGSFKLHSSENLEGGVRVDLWGDHLRFDGNANGRSYFDFRLMFDGHVGRDQIDGTLALFRNDEMKEYRWVARRKAAEFAGRWKWKSPTGPRDVRLTIERRDGRLTAAYHDRDRSFPIDDIYDFGGGFYFTHRVGREADGSIPITADTGWLIGEAIAHGNDVLGTIEFYPYPGEIARTAGIQSTRERWRPIRMAE